MAIIYLKMQVEKMVKVVMYFVQYLLLYLF